MVFSLPWCSQSEKGLVQVMYDVDAEHGGTSLNKELLQGSQLNNSLIGVLFESSLCKGGQMPMVELKY